MSEIVKYIAPDARLELEVGFEKETIWLNQMRMATFFEKDSDTIGLHLKRIFADEELDEFSTTEYFSVVQTEGKRQVIRTIRFYNLNAIISVGCRVKF